MAQGKSLAQIGREIGKDGSTVGYWVRKHGLIAAGRTKSAPRGALDRTRLEELVAAGLTIEALASEMGRSTSTISYWLKRYGLKLRRAPPVVDHHPLGRGQRNLSRSW
jgi:IS30 family transposase